MADSRKAPIRSTLVGDDALERLDAFVVGLGERIDGIQEADRQGEFDEAAKRALALAEEAAGLGLPPLVEAAERVVIAARDAEAAGVHEAIVELTDVVRRVRLGHRGATPW